eukprot:TRINITY_DN6355_c0_g1_i2.p1 TRINITY_DN6355_c0_g1~~TRINITY_DN6355_c0_g1_i2.p1  ORF type:complete len:528 (-),score=128.56 TRINITY_DN6355_c0_g1_i2:2180-3763(-)
MATVYLVASGDSRPAANLNCWATQAAMEAALGRAFERLGAKVVRAHAYDAARGHGFIDSQRMGLDVFRTCVPKGAPVVVAESVWEYSYFVLGGLRTHEGPILTVGNWDGTWPGLVGVLNINASLTKMGKPYSSLWSVSFEDEFFTSGLQTWLKTGILKHPTPHVREPDFAKMPAGDVAVGEKLGEELKTHKAIMGVFDEGCMGMYNAFFDDELLQPCGIYKERLSQSALFAEMGKVSTQEAWEAFEWCREQGMRFAFGKDAARELTVDQTLEQFKMYIAMARFAQNFSLDVVGIQYQQGLKDTCAASDLAEGLLNNAARPEVHDPTGEVLFKGKPIPVFNEADEGAGVDALVTNRVLTAMGFDPETTLHDIRWGGTYKGQFVWLFEISGAVPPNHLKGGFKGAVSERQPPMYFPYGGGGIKGASKPGEIVWSRVYAEGGRLHADLGRGTVIDADDAENERRWRLTTPQWPIMNAVLHGVTRDQMMARHKSNHIQVAYAPDAVAADRVATVKAAMFQRMGIVPHLCGI